MYIEVSIFVIIISASTATECSAPASGKYIDVSTDRAENLTSPGHPNNYTSDLQCRWVLVAARYLEAVVNVTIISLDIENSTDCERDSLQLYRGIQKYNQFGPSSHMGFNKRRQAANLCGTRQTPVSFLAEGAMDIYFTSNNETSGKGFIVEFRALLDVDEDGRKRDERTDSWGLVVVIVCVVVAAVLLLTAGLVCIISRRVKDPQPLTFDSPFAEDLPKESTGLPKESTGLPKESTGLPKESTDLPKESTGLPKKSTGGVTNEGITENDTSNTHVKT